MLILQTIAVSAKSVENTRGASLVNYFQYMRTHKSDLMCDAWLHEATEAKIPPCLSL